MKNDQISQNMNKFEDNLSPYACPNSKAVRLSKETTDIRPPFFRDIDRIIYSLSYTRYKDKTQVFTFNDNDHISKRITHVQMVSKIARTIGRALNLNEDLIEAAALGHDLGHTPFGHVGENIINNISIKHKEGYFNHNIQSVRTLMYLEDDGKGKNLTLQTLDAIMCHNGEFIESSYQPKNKTWDVFFSEYENSYKDKSVVNSLVPMTLEGCVVRISDLIAYIGKDIEDAIQLKIIKKADLPMYITNTLGSTNREMVNTIVLDIIYNSINKDYLKMSKKIYNAIVKLKAFNYKYIYLKANSKENLLFYEKVISYVFNTYLKDLKSNNKNSNIYKVYLNKMTKDYQNNNTKERIVLDYIAGMTDEFIISEYNKLIDSRC